MTTRNTRQAVSELELAEIRRRSEAATPGPWKAFIEGRDHESGSDFIATGEGASRGEDIELSGATPADFDFIANARQDIPKLLDEIERLRALLKKDVGGGGGNGAGGGAGGGVGGGFGSGSLTGQEAFTVAWAGTFFEKLADGGYNYTRARVMLSGTENAVCSPGVSPTSSNNLHVTFFTALAPRAYSLAEANVIGGVPYAGYAAATGSVTLTTVSTTRLEGSFDVSTTRGDGGLAPLTGSFTAPACSW